jgi:hypothetical protein
MADPLVGINQDLLAEAMTQASNSNSVAASPKDAGAAANPALQQLMQMSKQMGSRYGRALEAQEERERLESQDPASGQDKLLSARNIPLALGALAALLGGNPQAAAGIGIGAMQGSNDAAAAENAANAEKLDKMVEREDRELQRIENMHNRMTQVYNANFESFIDPETNQPYLTPEQLGFVLGGPEGMRLNAGSRWQLEMRGRNGGSTTMINKQIEAIQGAPDEPTATYHTVQLLRMLGHPVDDVAVEMYRNAYRNGGLQGIYEKAIQDADPDSVVAAFTQFAEEGRDPMFDIGGFTELLTFTGAKARAAGGSVEAEQAKAIAYLRAWLQQPTTGSELDRLAAEHGRNSAPFFEELMQVAFAEEPALGMAYRRWQMGVLPGEPTPEEKLQTVLKLLEVNAMEALLQKEFEKLGMPNAKRPSAKDVGRGSFRAADDRV